MGCQWFIAASLATKNTKLQKNTKFTPNCQAKTRIADKFCTLAFLSFFVLFVPFVPFVAKSTPWMKKPLSRRYNITRPSVIMSPAQVTSCHLDKWYLFTWTSDTYSLEQVILIHLNTWYLFTWTSDTYSLEQVIPIHLNKWYLFTLKSVRRCFWICQWLNLKNAVDFYRRDAETQRCK